MDPFSISGRLALWPAAVVSEDAEHPGRSGWRVRLAVLEVDWIVCRATERQVIEGRIKCPGDCPGEADRETRLEVCFDCRHLMATPLDRRREGTCATEV